jgi:hypothetical protein
MFLVKPVGDASPMVYPRLLGTVSCFLRICDASISQSVNRKSTLFLLISPISIFSSFFPLPAHPWPHAHKRKEQFFSSPTSDHGAIARTLPPKYATAPHNHVCDKAPKKIFLSHFPEGLNRSPGGALPPSRANA